MIEKIRLENGFSFYLVHRLNDEGYKIASYYVENGTTAELQSQLNDPESNLNKELDLLEQGKEDPNDTTD